MRIKLYLGNTVAVLVTLSIKVGNVIQEGIFFKVNLDLLNILKLKDNLKAVKSIKIFNDFLDNIDLNLI